MMIMSSKVSSQRNVPFSWENEPGVRKAVPPHHHHHEGRPTKLPPPPCPPEKSRVSYHDLQIPLPPCPFQGPPASRAFSKKVMKKVDDDPFLMAYKEVTKSTKEGVGANKGDHAMFGVVKKKNMSIFSCKQSSSCGVADESLVKMSQLPFSRSRRD